MYGHTILQDTDWRVLLNGGKWKTVSAKSPAWGYIYIEHGSQM